MAIFTPGGLIQAISGRFGGVVAVNGRGSKVLRRLRSTTNARSESQLSARAGLEHWSRAWAQLEEQLRLEWRTLARAIPFTNSLGLQRPLTGFQLFVWHYGPFWPRVSTPSENIPTLPRLQPPEGASAAFSATGAWNVSVVNPQPVAGALRYLKISREPTDFSDQTFVNFRRGPLKTSTAETIDWRADLEPIVGTMQEGQAFTLILRFLDFNRIGSGTIFVRSTVAA